MKVNFRLTEKYILYLYVLIAILFSYFLRLNLFYCEVGLLGLTLLTYMIFSQKVYIHPYVACWFAPLIFSWLSVVYSAEQSTSARYSLLLTFFVWMNIYIGFCDDNTMNKIIDCLWGACGAHVLFSLWQFFSSSSFYSFLKLFATSEWLSENRRFFRWGNLCGITDQTGSNGFFLSIFIIITVNKMMTEKRKSKKIFCLVMLLVALVMLGMTGKRMFMIAVAIMMICVWFLNSRDKDLKGIVRYIVITVLIIAIIGFVVWRTGVFTRILEKFIKYIMSGDITNGRIGLWKSTLKIWNDNMLFGVGINTMRVLILNNSHNVYIELLAEVGIVGAIFFYIALFYPFVHLLYGILKKKKLDIFSMLSLSIQFFFLLYSVTGNPLFDHKIMWIYALGLGISCRKEIKRSE